MTARGVPVLAGLLCLCGCTIETSGPPQHDFKTLDLDQAESVRVSLRMGAGELSVGSGTQKLMRADFTYNIPAWKPYVHYSNNGGRGDLSIEQPSNGHHMRMGHSQYDWDVRLSRDVPIELHVNFGAGKGRLDIGSLDLKSVDLDMGVGELNVDLRGQPKHSYDVHIRGGVGSATVRLPSDVGIVADAEGGIGSINVSGLRESGSHHYYNAASQNSKTTIRVDVHGGVGEIKLIAD